MSPDAEHLDRECERCGYRWAEQVLATPPVRQPMSESEIVQAYRSAINSALSGG